MSVTATVGFFPASGSASATAGLAVAGDKAAADGPLGLFGALLQLVSAVGEEQSPPAAQGVGDGPAVALGPLFERLTANVEAQGILTSGDTDGNAERDVPADLLAELASVLDALTVSTETDTPIDPTLEAKTIALLETIAGALGVPLPVVEAAKVVAPAPAAAVNAGIDPGAAIGPTAAPAGAGAPGDATYPARQPLGTATPVDAPPSAATPAKPSSAPSELPPVLRELADKLTKLAAAVEPKAPALAARIAALGQTLASGEIDLAALAGLRQPGSSLPTEETIHPAIQRLLTPAPDPTAAPLPKPFAAATLEMPVALGDKPKAATAGEVDSQRPSPAGAPAAESDSGDNTVPRTGARAADGSMGDPAPNARPATPAATAATTTAPGDTTGANAQPAPSTAGPVTQALLGTFSADTRAVHAAYSAPVQQINIPQVAFEIVRQVQVGATRFQIRLDPPELGRIDVKLDMDAAGNVNARMTVDRAETLDLMQRDHRALERALAQAGLDSNKTNLEFSLRQNPFSHQEQQQQRGNGHQPWTPIAPGAETDTSAVPAAHVIAYRGTASPGGVNLFV